MGFLRYSSVAEKCVRLASNIQFCEPRSQIWRHSIAVIMPDCLSGDRGSIPRGVATAESAAINIDVPVQIRPRYLVYVSPWDIKIAEETTDISRRGCWYPTQPRVLLAEAFYWVKKTVLLSITIWPETSSGGPGRLCTSPSGEQ